MKVKNSYFHMSLLITSKLNNYANIKKFFPFPHHFLPFKDMLVDKIINKFHSSKRMTKRANNANELARLQREKLSQESVL